MTNIINNFKNILNNSNTSSNDTTTTNLNITPEMISNIAGIVSNNSSHSSESTNTQTQNSSSNDSRNDSSTNNIDFDTILKIKSIIETLNQSDDPRSNLLYSLKPYLRENRQKKIDQYVNLLKITKITDLFKNEKGDGN